MTADSKERIAITLGDPNGIGPEVVLKCLDDPLLMKRVEPVVIGSKKALEVHSKSLGRRPPVLIENMKTPVPKRGVRFLDTSEGEEASVEIGQVTPKAGMMAMKAVDAGILLAKQKKISALVTGPISKLAIIRAGYNFPGHTEYLAKKTKVKDQVMMMVSRELRISLATAHIPLKQVSGKLTVNGLVAKLKRVQRSLVNDFGIIRPKIAVLGLNPHAGEKGVLGHEEEEVIIKAIKDAGNRGILALGPFPADGFFGSGQYCDYDCILAMYHDQGLAPFKILSFGRGVNFTAGLPIVRTSPDHGTAFDIAGKNQANEGSMIQAVLQAASIAGQRRSSQ